MHTSAILKEALCDLLQTERTPEQKTSTLIYQTVNYIQAHYQKDISNEEIAQAMGYNSLYLNRIFKEFTGMTLHSYVTQEKINAAILLLRGTNLSIESIAQACGFSASALFCTTFRSITGQTPSEYRKNGQFPSPESIKINF